MDLVTLKANLKEVQAEAQEFLGIQHNFVQGEFLGGITDTCTQYIEYISYDYPVETLLNEAGSSYNTTKRSSDKRDAAASRIHKYVADALTTENPVSTEDIFRGLGLL
jgi:hypothetical protein